MKIAIVTEDLVGQGVQYVTAMTARSFARHGWNVDVIVSQYHRKLLEQGQRSFDLTPGVRLLYMPFVRARWNVLFLRDYIKRTNADIVLAETGTYAKAIALATIGLSRKNLPHLVQLQHGNGPEYSRCRWWRWLGALKFWMLYRKFSILLSVNRTAMERSREYAALTPRLRFDVVHNACVDEVFREKRSRPPLHPWLINKNVPTFVAAGSYTPGKCFGLLLRAMTVVRDRGVRARVIIFGRGYEESDYRKYISANRLEEWVSIGGFTDQLPAELQTSDGLISASNEESFGLTIAEALACGKPVVSADAPYGPREILADGKYGRLIPVNNLCALADAIVDLAQGRVPAPPDESWERFTIEAVERRYFDVLGMLLK